MMNRKSTLYINTSIHLYIIYTVHYIHCIQLYSRWTIYTHHHTHIIPLPLQPYLLKECPSLLLNAIMQVVLSNRLYVPVPIHRCHFDIPTVGYQIDLLLHAQFIVTDCKCKGQIGYISLYSVYVSMCVCVYILVSQWLCGYGVRIRDTQYIIYNNMYLLQFELYLYISLHTSIHSHTRLYKQ